MDKNYELTEEELKLIAEITKDWDMGDFECHTRDNESATATYDPQPGPSGAKRDLNNDEDLEGDDISLIGEFKRPKPYKRKLSKKFCSFPKVRKS